MNKKMSYKELSLCLVLSFIICSTTVVYGMYDRRSREGAPSPKTPPRQQVQWQEQQQEQQRTPRVNRRLFPDSNEGMGNDLGSLNQRSQSNNFDFNNTEEISEENNTSMPTRQRNNLFDFEQDNWQNQNNRMSNNGFNQHNFHNRRNNNGFRQNNFHNRRNNNGFRQNNFNNRRNNNGFNQHNFNNRRSNNGFNRYNFNRRNNFEIPENIRVSVPPSEYDLEVGDLYCPEPKVCLIGGSKDCLIFKDSDDSKDCSGDSEYWEDII